jgi:hypothetical protein
MNTQHEQTLTKLVGLLNSGADFYRQAEQRYGNADVASKLKSIVKVREAAVDELQPYLAAITSNSAITASAEQPAPGYDWHVLIPAKSEAEPLTVADLERVEGETLEALDQAIQIPASQSLQTLLSDIRGRTSACCYKLRQMRQADA